MGTTAVSEGVLGPWEPGGHLTYWRESSWDTVRMTQVQGIGKEAWASSQTAVRRTQALCRKWESLKNKCPPPAHTRKHDGHKHKTQCGLFNREDEAERPGRMIWRRVSGKPATVQPCAT